MQQFKRIVLLAASWDTTPIVYNFLAENTGVEKAVIENRVPRKEFLKKRIKKLGWINVGGQVLFQLFVARFLTKTAKDRVAEILEQNGLKTTPIPSEKIIAVNSVNTDECIQQLKALQPDLIVVHGTRIIAKRVLQSVACPVLNIHAGITPRYRGSHGGYWALASGDKENFGVTVHLVDSGIDTGNILFQRTIPVTDKDNFASYSYLQLAEGLRLLKQAIRQLEEGKITPVQNNLNSALWHHPTLWGYLMKRVSRGVK